MLADNAGVIPDEPGVPAWPEGSSNIQGRDVLAHNAGVIPDESGVPTWLDGSSGVQGRGVLG